jgi:hypothetical protein
LKGKLVYLGHDLIKFVEAQALGSTDRSFGATLRRLLGLAPRRRSKYIFADMEVGEELVAPWPEDEDKRKRRLMVRAVEAQIQWGKGFEMWWTPMGLRVRRTR